MEGSVKKEKEEGNGINKILLILACIFALSTGFFLFQFISTNSDLETSIANETAAVSERDKLQAEFDAQLKELEGMKGENAEMNAKIDQLMADLEAAKEQLSKFDDLGSYDQLRAYKAQYFTFKKQAEDLRKRVQELEAENAALKTENTGLKTDLNKEKKMNQDLTIENADLANKVAIGSVLKAYQLNVNGVKISGDKEKIKTKAKKIDKIRTCFTISENAITERGVKEVFLRIVGPGDKVLTNGGSNFFYNGSSIAYSAKQEVDYQGNQKDICFRASNPEGEFEAGTYRAEVYVDGNKIGEKTLSLD